MADDNLFRKRAVDAKRDNRLGVIAISQPIGIWVLGGIAMAILIVAVVFSIFVEYTRKTEVTGRLVPTAGLSTLTADGAGNVNRLFVKEGDIVKIGDPLVLIETDRTLADGRNVNEALIAGLDAKQWVLSRELTGQDALMTTQLQAMKVQLRETQLELLNLHEELMIRKNQVNLSTDTLDRFRSLLEQKYVSKIQVTQQEQALLEQRANVETLQRHIATLRRNLSQIQQSIKELPVRNHLLHIQMEREKTNLEQERITGTASVTTMIKAKSSGTVSNKLVEQGQSVQLGQPIMTIVPKSSNLQAQLLVPSSAIGLIRNGNEVILRYRAFPFQEYGHHRGRVTEVAESALTTREITGIIGEAATQESFYRVIVELENQFINNRGMRHPLRPGMDVDAKILGESRTLWKWLSK